MLSRGQKKYWTNTKVKMLDTHLLFFLQLLLLAVVVLWVLCGYVVYVLCGSVDVMRMLSIYNVNK